MAILFREERKNPHFMSRAVSPAGKEAMANPSSPCSLLGPPSPEHRQDALPQLEVLGLSGSASHPWVHLASHELWQEASWMHLLVFSPLRIWGQRANQPAPTLPLTLPSCITCALLLKGVLCLLLMAEVLMAPLCMPSA